jgi:hypothetical protein
LIVQGEFALVFQAHVLCCKQINAPLTLCLSPYSLNSAAYSALHDTIFIYKIFPSFN